MTDRQRIGAGIAVMLVVAAIGTIGYVIIEDLAFLDALYTAVITISTVGFAEPAGGFSAVGSVFTMVLIIFGVGAVFYTAAVGLEKILDETIGGGRIRRRERKKVITMRDHFILCGFGQVGSATWSRLRSRPSVVIEPDPDRAAEARRAGAMVVEGDATRDETLIEAGVGRAELLIACVQSDSDNLAIVLSSRALNKDLSILARATDPESTRKLKLAGADFVVAPQVVGAERLAALALNPDLAEFVDIAGREELVEFRVQEITIPDGSTVDGKTVKEAGIRGETGAIILAVKAPGTPIQLSPSAEFVLKADQVMVCIGTEPQLTALGQYAGSG